MLIVIRNMTGLDLFLAGIATERSFRIRILLAPPDPSEKGITVRLRKGDVHGIPGCPEGLAVRLTAPAGSIRVIRRKELVDGLDEDNEPTGPETYLVFTLRLMN